ncbi:MAG: DoxX family protein [Alphaproteobacteria bacterium]|nr:DoxX family protein [Alphaproteobacteria bacterium]
MNNRYLEPAAALLGRLLLSAIFLHEAFAKLTGYATTLAYMEMSGIPGATLPLAIAVELGGSLAILAGFQTRMAALMLAGFCVATAFVFHTRLGVRNELIHFEKDFAIAGGFLVLAAFGAGAWSVDAWMRRRIVDRRSQLPESATTRAW